MEEVELKNPISQSLMIVAENSLENDKALLKMGEAIIEQMNAVTDLAKIQTQQILDLQEKILDLHEKLEIVATIVHTHFGPVTRH